MATPANVRADAAAAEQQLREIATQMAGNQPPAPTPEVPVDEPAAPTPSLDDTPSLHSDHPNAVQPVAPVQPTSGPVSGEDIARLQRQNDALQGRLNAASQENAANNARIDMLERLVASVRMAVPEAPVAAPSLITAADNAEFGEDLIDCMRRVFREESQGALSTILDQVQNLGNRVGSLEGTTGRINTHVAQGAELQFNAAMDAAVTDANGTPDWVAINTMHQRGDTRFIDWLAQVGEESDETRQTVLNRARSRNDAAACAKIFLRFKRDVGLPTKGEPIAAQAPNPAAALVSPSPSAPSNPNNNRGRPRMLSMQDMLDHYDAKTKGTWKGTREEWLAKEAEFNKALAEGRLK